jgi:transposase InsO family protein
MANQYLSRVPLTKLAQWLSLCRSTYYYRPHPGPRGLRPSTHTTYQGQLVSNDEVLSYIRAFLFNEPYSAYGYDQITDQLRLAGFVINRKKTYRLMDENNLLLGKVIRCKGQRRWVKYRKITASRPMEYLCLDIKYVWVHGDHRWYYLLSIMDVYSRKIMIWLSQKSIRKMDVINLFRTLHHSYNLKGVFVRNDNGSQFIANQVRQFLSQLEAQQEFTHVATPEENAYIEAFHSVMDRELIQRFEFSGFYDAKQHIIAYMNWYNERRRHREIGKMTPQQKWEEGLSGSVDKQSAQVAEEGLSRPTDTNETSINNQSLCISLDKPVTDTYFRLPTDQEKNTELHNQNLNSVQTIGG